MINMQNASATQLTDDRGIYGDWSVVLDGKEIYTLPKKMTVQDTFDIRDAVHKMVELSHKEAADEANSLASVKINRIVENGNHQLELLKAENIRLSEALEKIMMDEEV